MKRLLFITILCAFISAPAFADLYGTADVEWVGTIRGMDLSMASSASFGTIELVEDIGLQQLRFTNVNLSGPPTIPADSYFNLGYEQAFCIDMYDSTPVGPEAPITYNVLSLDAAPDPYAVPTLGGMGPTKAAFIAELLINNTYATAQDAAALQVAMWEILDENYSGGTNPWNVSKGQGNFYLDTALGNTDEIAVAGLANIMLGNLTTGLPFDRYTAVSNGPGTKNWQDFVVVPVPTAVLLGILGLGVAGLKLRKFA